MTEEIDAVSTCGNPSSLTLKVYAGADGSFSLYEDDNETCDYEKGICAITEFEWKWDGEQRLQFIRCRASFLWYLKRGIIQ